MANKNTKRAHKRGLSAHDEITIGTGEGRQVRTIERDPIFKGSAVHSTNPIEWKAKKYPRITKEQRAKAGY